MSLNAIIDAAQCVAADKKISVHEVLLAILAKDLEDLADAVKDTGRDDPRIEDLQKDQLAMMGGVQQVKDWLHQVRPGMEAHETKIETLMDAVQSLVTKQSEQAQLLVDLQQRVGIS